MTKKRCPNCGYINPYDKRYCMKCNAELDTGDTRIYDEDNTRIYDSGEHEKTRKQQKKEEVEEEIEEEIDNVVWDNVIED